MNITNYLIIICVIFFVVKAHAHDIQYSARHTTEKQVCNTKSNKHMINQALAEIGLIMDGVGSMLVILIVLMNKMHIKKIYIRIVGCSGFLLIIIGILLYIL